MGKNDNKEYGCAFMIFAFLSGIALIILASK